MTDTVDKVIIQSETQGVQQSTSELNQLGKSMDGVTVASQNVEKSTTSVEGKFAALERRFSTTAGQAAQLEKIQRTVNTAVAQNPQLQDRANAVLAAAEARYIGSGKAVTELAAAHKGLDSQGQAALHSVRSIVEQLAMGIPPTQALTGQINHLTYAASGEGGLAGAFKQVGGFVSGLITPTTAAIAGVAALAAGAAYAAAQFDKMQVSAQRAISGAGARTGTTTSDINAFVDKNTPSALSGSTLSQKESRALAEGLTQTGDIVISKLQSMSAAVVGFSNQTGQSMDESVKAFAKMGSDPVKALDELAGAFGPFSQGTRTLVQDMVEAGDKTQAWNAILNELGPTAKGTAGNMTVAEMATRGFINVLQTAQKPTGLEKQLDDVRQKLNGAIEAANQFAAHGVEAPPEVSNSIVALSKSFEDLYAREQAVIGLKASGTFNDLADKARLATEAIIPEIAQLEQLRAKLEELERAKESGAKSKSGADVDNSAALAYSLLIAKAEELQQANARANVEIANIGLSWGNVSQSTALALQAAENQLPVIQAITGAEQMAAQAAADYNNALIAGKAPADALALASSKLEASEAAATAAVEKQIESLKDQNAMIKARQNGTEASTAAAIAYKNAIESGADASSAAALQSQMMANYMQQASTATAQWRAELLGVGSAITVVGANYSKIAAAQAAEDRANDAATNDLMQKIASHEAKLKSEAAASSWDPAGFYTSGIRYDPTLGTSQNISDVTNKAYTSGGLNAAIASLSTIKGAPSIIGGQFWSDKAAIPVDYNSLFSEADTLYGLKNAMTNDKNVQVANLQEEMALIQSMPASVERDQKLVDLRQSIDQLKNSTDQLNNTNSELLSPYYTQDPRTSHIGFRSQGMASGGYVDVPGSPSANDNMVAQIPVASGERIYVDPMPSKRGGGSNGNNVYNITIPMSVVIQGGANKDEVGRTMYQAAQSMARQLAAVR